jgi:hypothetical protein
MPPLQTNMSGQGAVRVNGRVRARVPIQHKDGRESEASPSHDTGLGLPSAMARSSDSAARAQADGPAAAGRSDAAESRQGRPPVGSLVSGLDPWWSRTSLQSSMESLATSLQPIATPWTATLGEAKAWLLSSMRRFSLIARSGVGAPHASMPLERLQLRAR